MLFLSYTAEAVDVYNDRKSRLGRLVKGDTKFKTVNAFEAEL